MPLIEIPVTDEVLFSVGLGMAMMERHGIRRIIDKEALKVDKRAVTLSCGMASKALIGTMFTEKWRKPLYAVNSAYSTSPTERLFGRSVTPATLADEALADRLDTIFKLDLDEVQWQASNEICRAYGLMSDVYHMDSTNYPLFGIDYEDWTGCATIPEYNNHSKVNLNTKLHKNVQAVVNGNGIMLYGKPYSGTVSDPKMNGETLGFMESHIDCSRSTVIADNKLTNLNLIQQMMGLGLGFISKVPESFCNHIQNDIVRSAVTGIMDEVEGMPGRFVYDTDSPVTLPNGSVLNLRYVAFRLPNGITRATEYLTNTGVKKAGAKFRALGKRRFDSEERAMAAFDKLLEDLDGVYTAEPVFEFDEGRKDPEKRGWRVRTGETTIVESAMADSTERYATNVLVTNLPRTENRTLSIRNGIRPEKVVELYLDEYKVEQRGFKMMKSGAGVNHVYIHTPSRQDAVVFLSGVATGIANVIDTVLKDQGVMKPRKKREHMTTKYICDFMPNVRVEYEHETDTLRVKGYRGAGQEVMTILDALGLEPKHLLGY